MLDPRLAGKRDIAADLGCHPFQLLRYASLHRGPLPLHERYRDPLRLDELHGVLVIRRSRLTAWRNRNLRGGAGERKVYGWPAIVERIHLRRSAGMAAAGWEVDPLPVVRPEHGRPWAYESALDEWLEARTHSFGVHQMLRERRRSERAKARPSRGRASKRDAVSAITTPSYGPPTRDDVCPPMAKKKARAA